MRLGVCCQCLPEAVLFFRRQVKGLFGDGASPHLVFHDVGEVIGYAQHIVCFAFGEAVDEVGFGEVEYAVVEDEVKVLIGVLYAESRMSVEREYFFVGGGTGQYTDNGLFAKRLLCKEEEREAYRQAEEQYLFHAGVCFPVCVYRTMNFKLFPAFPERM